MKRYTKEDVETHSLHYHDKPQPAVNVKVYRFVPSITIEDRFKCTEAQAEKALEFAFEFAQRDFWEQAEELVKEIFPGHACYSAGRSGGWCVVDGLQDVEYWDAIQLGKWRKLERLLKENVKYLTGEEYVIDAIESNQWYKDGAEQYNFLDRNGETVCIAGLKAQAAQAGFSPVIRK